MFSTASCILGRADLLKVTIAAAVVLVGQAELAAAQDAGQPSLPGNTTPAADNDQAEEIPLPEYTLDRPMSELTIQIEPTAPSAARSAGEEKYPLVNRAPEYFQTLQASEDVSETRPQLGVRPFYWAAPGFYHRPLYFEQINVERYGHHVCCGPCSDCAQSAVCAAHFFASVPLLPYKMGADPCCERQYTLGHYRPGSCNPHQWHFVRPTRDGLACEAMMITGLIFLIP
jgi:hypothetical protein